MYGNRGLMHDDAGRIVRRAQVRRWLVCELSFRGRRRPLLRPRRFTELFFVDEAVALAAGHRPCAQCRYGAYQEFRRLWTATRGLARPPSADDMDDVLHVERALDDDGRRRTRPEPAGDLPDGTFVTLPDGPHLVVAGGARPWSPSGYGPRTGLPGPVVPVLTPPATLAVLRAGYRPRLHPTAM